MAELTQEALEQALSRVATKEDLRAFATKDDLSHSGRQAETIAAAVADLASVVNAVGERLGRIEDTLNAHTKSLDALLKQTRDWNSEMAAMRKRMDRYEDALKLVGRKLNIDVSGLLD